MIVTPTVYPRFIEFLHFDFQSTVQKYHCVNTRRGPSQCFVLMKQSDSPGPVQSRLLGAGRGAESRRPPVPGPHRLPVGRSWGDPREGPGARLELPPRTCPADPGPTQAPRMWELDDLVCKPIIGSTLRIRCWR